MQVFVCLVPVVSHRGSKLSFLLGAGDQSDRLHRGDGQHGRCHFPLAPSRGVAAPLRRRRQVTRQPAPTSRLPCGLCDGESKGQVERNKTGQLDFLLSLNLHKQREVQTRCWLESNQFNWKRKKK